MKGNSREGSVVILEGVKEALPFVIPLTQIAAEARFLCSHLFSGERWIDFKIPRHAWYFPATHIRVIAEVIGALNRGVRKHVGGHRESTRY